MAKKKANLSDVASLAGVNKSTVSKVLNNKLGDGFTVSDEVRKKIFDVAKRLNYRPNLIAQSLTSNQPQMIVVLGGNHALRDRGNIYQTVVNEITEYFEKSLQNYVVSINMSHHGSNLSELPPWKVSGVIILASCSTATMAELEESKTPYIVINGPADSSGLSITLDDVDGTRQAIEYFIELGHTNISYASPLKTLLAGHSSIKDRQHTSLRSLYLSS
ncbi:MAG: LacI family DNA-binding transcriptional regulator [Planctomycetota bacterium]|jgi:LacI family transcriptional regulator